MTTISRDRQERVFSPNILRLAGYGLLLMAVVNICWLLIPFKLMNPLWEFQTVGRIMERIPVVLLGMVLVYYIKPSDRTSVEAIILKGLSWLSLMFAILLMLIVPLNISNSFSIYYQHDPVPQEHDLIQQFKARLEAANSQAEIGAVLQQQVESHLDLPNSANTQQLKTKILNNLSRELDRNIGRTTAFRAQKRSMLVEKCLKWNLGALVAAVLFFMLWQNTAWVRLADRQCEQRS